MLFSVNNVDFTRYIISSSYDMAKEDEYIEWKDAYGFKRKDIYRTRISGSFELKFINRAKYNEFLGALSAVKTDGYYPVTVFVNTTLATETINAFIHIAPKMKAQYSDYPEMEQFSVEVEQR